MRRDQKSMNMTVRLLALGLLSVLAAGCARSGEGRYIEMPPADTPVYGGAATPFARENDGFAPQPTLPSDVTDDEDAERGGRPRFRWFWSRADADTVAEVPEEPDREEVPVAAVSPSEPELPDEAVDEESHAPRRKWWRFWRRSRAVDDEVPAIAQGARDGQSRSLKYGDVITIVLRGIPKEEVIKDVIDDHGMINLPFINEMSVAGKTASEIERDIQKAYIDGGIYKYVSVSVVPPESAYFVQGEVRAPGRYSLTGDITLLQAIAVAGGYTDYAKRTRVEILRGDEVQIYNAKRLSRQPKDDPIIKNGDIIKVLRSHI